MAAFAIPDVSPARLEETYAALAHGCVRKAAPPGLRIAAITFTHNGQSWTARVGSQLSG
jgi:hypothetical protein